MNAIEPYTDKGPRRQFVSQIIVSKSELPIREKAAFVKDLIHFQNGGHVEIMLNEIGGRQNKRSVSEKNS